LTPTSADADRRGTGTRTSGGIASAAARVASRCARAIEGIFAKVRPDPIILLGNQKSGTTAIAALLAEMTGLSATLDLEKEMKDPVIDRVKTGGLSMREFVARNKLDFSREIIKEPSLSPYYPELAAEFPRARFVMVIRDPRDNIRSILNRLKISGSLSNIPERERARVSRAWELILDGRWLGLDGGNYIAMLAQRWNYIVDLYLANPDRMILVKYEDFSKNKIGKLDELASALGLEKRNDVSSRVDVQFQPAGDRNVRWKDFFGPENLSAIERICGDRMRGLGYPPSA
jgi:hypothetical protein